ncbi:glycosyltransferase family 4 protein [Arsenophonus nasoniae]|uniref:Glycosyltransferase family 4 protein n=2 Tax=Arsenophonus nasoniae TaxID=638 RepID=A0AA95GYM4_9GAMM|nr:glycosyltransferase family 4 protein [Arsenophonus nasoniae]WGM02687.1 glycosyltransferase family 4 protein [Arsenophonus nasoniae]
MNTSIIYTESSMNFGGQEAQALLQMKGLIHRGFNVTLACHIDSQIAHEAKKNNIPIYHVAFINSAHPASIMRLRKLLRQQQTILAICHSGHDANNLAIAVKTLAKKQRPCVLRQKTYLSGKIKAFSMNYLFDYVIVPSEPMRETLLQSGCMPQKVKVVHPGFDFSKMVAEKQTPIADNILTWINEGTAPIIIQVGMLREEKGHDIVLAALAQLKRQGRSFRYLIIGDGACKAKLRKKIIDYNLEPETLLAGIVFPSSSIYSYASLTVIPSNKEAFGMVAVESLFFAVPVFASNVGGLPDIIQDKSNGLLLPPSDINNWIAAIDDFLQQPKKYQEMALRGQLQVTKKFSIESCLLRLLQIGKVYDINLHNKTNQERSNN